jgi:CubicO group peptidase (beta-lactamase class C family)
MQAPLFGFVAPGFEGVRDAFQRDLDSGDECGASFAVVLDGRTVVDLWGGFRDRARTKPVAEHDLFNVWSTTKGLTATCIAMLVDRGKIDYAAPVTRYWPEFGEAGKDRVTVGMLLSHQAGICGPADRVSVAHYYDHAKMVSLLAAQEPFWPPGSASGYHAIVFGHLASELVRRTDGRTLGRFFAEEVAGPLGAEAHIGLPEDKDALRVTMIRAREEAPRRTSPNFPALRAALGNPPMDPEVPNERAFRAAELGGAGGSANARGISRVYGALARGGEIDGVRLLSAEAIAKATTPQIENVDLVLGYPVRWGCGFALNAARLYGPNEATFGHSGWGGSLGFADPVAKLGVSYAMNQMSGALQGDPRPQALIQATYACL